MSAMSRQQRTKGEAYIIEAEKSLKKSTWFSSSTDQKYEDAAELYEKAANAFKVGHYHAEAANAYMKAADLYRDKLKNMGEASKALTNAGASFKKTNPAEAITAYRSAVSLLCDAGRLTQAAKLSKQIAELFEEDASTAAAATDGNTTNEANSGTTLAIESYEQAAELFTMEDQKSQASQCLGKVAELCSAQLHPPDLLRAASIYDDLGKQCLESNLLKYNAKNYFLHCILCHLAHGDAIAGAQALERYENLDYTFRDSREGKFCGRLVECVEQFDAEGFATACYEFDRISKLDPWKTTMLVQVKRSIEEQTGDGAGIGDTAMDGDDVDLT